MQVCPQHAARQPPGLTFHEQRRGLALDGKDKLGKASGPMSCPRGAGRPRHAILLCLQGVLTAGHAHRTACLPGEQAFNCFLEHWLWAALTPAVQPNRCSLGGSFVPTRQAESLSLPGDCWGRCVALRFTSCVWRMALGCLPVSVSRALQPRILVVSVQGIRVACCG